MLIEFKPTNWILNRFFVKRVENKTTVGLSVSGIVHFLKNRLNHLHSSKLVCLVRARMESVTVFPETFHWIRQFTPEINCVFKFCWYW